MDKKLLKDIFIRKNKKIPKKYGRFEFKKYESEDIFEFLSNNILKNVKNATIKK